ncbi:MAG: outer membrane beta-barrel protein [Fermentimonas sp.]|jgi:hypothetical protein
MKRFLIRMSLSALFGLLSLSNGFAQFEGTFGVGVQAGYGSNIKSVGGGMHLHYYHTNELRFAPSFTRFIERKDTDMWMVETDAHYILPVSVALSLYPIAGLSYSQWSYNETMVDQELIPARKERRLGANLGLGWQHDIAYRIRANYELKYQFIRDHSQLLFTAGFGFWF